MRQLEKDAYQNELLFEVMDDRLLILEKANSIKDEVISLLQSTIQDIQRKISNRFGDEFKFEPPTSSSTPPPPPPRPYERQPSPNIDDYLAQGLLTKEQQIKKMAAIKRGKEKLKVKNTADKCTSRTTQDHLHRLRILCFKIR